MKKRRATKRIIALTMAVLLAVCSFIDTGTGYVYADENEYQVEETGNDVLEADPGILGEPETEEEIQDTTENPEEDTSTEVSTEESTTEVPTETATEEIKWSGRFVYMGEEEPEELSANGAGLESVDGELNADGTIDWKIYALQVNFTNHAPLTLVPVLNPDGSVVDKGPAVMYAKLMVGDTERALSLFCINHGAPASTGDLFTLSDENAYAELNRDQKVAISYVLGCDAAMKQAPNSGSGFNENIDFNEWQKYYSTQLMIWYYINEFRVGNTGNKGITWDQVVATCAGGYGDQGTCNAIKAQVDSYYQIPSFAINKRAIGHTTTPSYKLKYTGGKYQITLTNTNAACNLTYFFGAVGNATTATVGNTTVTYTRISENQIKVTSDKMIPNSSKSSPVSAERSFKPQMGNLTYLVNMADHDLTNPQDFIECIDARQGDPVGMVFDVYTEDTGTIRVYKEAVTAMTTMYSMKGATYGVFKTKADAQANQNPVNYIVINKQDSKKRWYGDTANPVPFGTYYVKETETPHDDSGATGHWKLDDTIYTVKVSAKGDPSINVGKTTDITSKEQNYTAQIHVVKQSALPSVNNDQSTMQGAVYGVFKTQSAAQNAKTNYTSTDAAKTGAKADGAEATAVIKKYSSGVYGNANGLPLGVYYVKEIYAPSGWTLDETIHKVDATGRNNSTYVTSKTVTSTETPEYGLIYVGKTRKANPFDNYGGSHDIGGTTSTMAGAEYGVFKTKADAQAAQIKTYDETSAYTDKRVTTITIANGTGTTEIGGPDLSKFTAVGVSGELPKGTYYVVETKAPEGWLRDRTIYQKTTSTKFTDRNGVYYTVVGSEEVEQSGAIEVYKTDATGTTRIADATLKGAKYGLYAFNGSQVHSKIPGVQIVTDETGYGYVEGVPAGTYYVKEEVPAPGYTLDPNEYEVEVTPDMVAGVTPVPKVESKETPILTDYEISKITVEDESGATDPTPLAGCTFALYLKSELDANKLTYENGKLALTFNYDEDGNVITDGTVLDGVAPYYTADTDETGKAVFKDCYKGDYIVVETKVGRREDGIRYRAIDPYEISLPIADGNGYKTKETVTLTDELIGSNIRILKLDTKTGTKITGTATFKLYNLDKKEYVKMSVNGTLTDTFTTDADGYITFDNRLAYGHYRLEEVEASNWYGLANLEINVADGYVEYRELDDDNKPAGPWTKCGTVEENGVTFNIVRAGDTPHHVTVEKVDEKGNRLVGATLAIVYADTANQVPKKKADGSYDILQIAKMDGDQPVLKDDGTFEMVDAKWKSENELKVWGYVPEGDYYLVEIEAPKGYETAEPIAFSVSNKVKTIKINGKLTKVDERDQTITMVDRKLDVRISKRDITNDKELPGAELKVTDKDGKVIDQWTSTDEEHIIKNIVPGKYTLTEVVAPKNYAVANSIEFEVKNTHEVQRVVMKDELIGRVRVAKTGPFLTGVDCFETEVGDVYRLRFEQKPFAGITFTIFNAETDEAVCTFTTGTDEVTYSPYLNIGQGQTYYMMETAAPAGVVMSKEKYPCKIVYNEESGEYQTDIIKIENKVQSADINVYKQGELIIPNTKDKFGIEQKGIPNVYFGVYTAESIKDYTGKEIVKPDTLVGVGKTDDEGKASIREALVAGKYYWKEIKADEGYVLDDTKFDFEIKYTDNSTEDFVTFMTNANNPLLNKYYTAKVTLNKKGDDGSVLEGVVFDLYRTTDGKDQKIGQYTTDKNGQIIIENLPYGQYYFREVKGLAGYLFDTEIRYSFEVKAKENQEIELTVTNERAKHPKTGDVTPVTKAMMLLLVAMGGCGTLGIMTLEDKRRKAAVAKKQDDEQ